MSSNRPELAQVPRNRNEQRINQTFYKRIGNGQEAFIPQSHLSILGKQRSHGPGDLQAL
jgi:hypothetical protein